MASSTEAALRLGKQTMVLVEVATGDIPYNFESPGSISFHWFQNAALISMP